MAGSWNLVRGPGVPDDAWLRAVPAARAIAIEHDTDLALATVEGETLLSRAQAEQGGRLTRLAIAHAEQLGGLTGWRPDRPVTQWEFRA